MGGVVPDEGVSFMDGENADLDFKADKPPCDGNYYQPYARDHEEKMDAEKARRECERHK